jgi:predicted nucleic acid-binding protein
MQLATAGLFQAKWSDEIHSEWKRNLLANRPDITAEKLDRVARLMNKNVPDAIVADYEYLIPVIKDLPDPTDAHVIAAAIHSNANGIVTFNLKDFPATILRRHNLEVIHPDEFITNQIDLDQAKVVTAAQRCCSRLINPAIDGEEYVAILERQGLPRTVQFLRKFSGVFCAYRGESVVEPTAEVIDLVTRPKQAQGH